MDWYIITKQKMTPREAFLEAAGNKIRRLGQLFKTRDIFDAGDSRAGAYDNAPQLIVKSTTEYPDSASIKSFIEELQKDKVAYAVLANDAREAVQCVYMHGLIYSGEREALNKQCPKAAQIDPDTHIMPVFYTPEPK